MAHGIGTWKYYFSEEVNCKNVTRSWKTFVEDPHQKRLCIRFIKNREKNTLVKGFISVQQKWSKLKIQDLGKFAKRLSLEKDEAKIEEMFLEKYADLKVELNGRDQFEGSIIHFFLNIHFLRKDDWCKILAEILLKNFNVYNIDINAKEAAYGYTAFHAACFKGNKRFVEILIENSELTHLDLKAINNFNETGFQVAQKWSQKEIVNLIKEKLPVGKY